MLPPRWRVLPWWLATLIGVLFTSVWNFAVTSMTTWRQERRSSEQHARRRFAAAAEEAVPRSEENAPAKPA